MALDVQHKAEHAHGIYINKQPVLYILLHVGGSGNDILKL